MLTVRQGTRNNDVKLLQLWLLSLSYIPGPIDGIFGSMTKQAVIHFQKDNSLTPDGVVGPITWKVLQRKERGYQLYSVQGGDTLYKLALEFEMSLTDLVAINPGINPFQLQIGQQIWVQKINSKPLLIRSVAGWIPYWLQAEALRSAESQTDLFHTFSPFWYEVTPSGEIIKYPGAEDSVILTFAKSQGIKMIPLITNVFSSERISSVLNDPVIRQNHINSLTILLGQMNYDGIDINYENLFVTDREIYVIFLQELKMALHTIGKQLVVTVHAKTDPRGIWSGSEAHDYVGIGQAADAVRIMGYDFHWQGGVPGPIAPADWIDGVLAYAVSAIPRGKVVLGVPTYGYDWPLSQKGQGITYNYAVSTASRYNVPILEDAQLGPHYTYSFNNVGHEVWFSDANSLATLLDLVNKYAINGICFWYLGAEDPNIYSTIRTRFRQLL